LELNILIIVDLDDLYITKRTFLIPYLQFARMNQKQIKLRLSKMSCYLLADNLRKRNNKLNAIF